MSFTTIRPYWFVFGDSLTQNGFASNGWLASLAGHYCRKVDVINRGFSGYNTRWGLKLIENGLFESLPSKDRCDGMIIWFGANDAVLPSSGIRQFVPLDEFRSNLKTMIEAARAYFGSSVNIILLTPPPVDTVGRIAFKQNDKSKVSRNISERSNKFTELYAQAVLDIVHEFQEGEQVHSIDLYMLMQKRGNWKTFLSDGLHLSPDGSQFIFEQLVEYIDKKLPKYGFEALPNHMPWHTEIDRKASIFGENHKSTDLDTNIKVLRNGLIWDWNTLGFTKKDIAISKGQFIKAPRTRSEFEEIDLEGKFVLPGLVDGQSRKMLDLEDCDSIQELKSRLRSYLNQHKQNKWILGGGWDQEQMPSRKDLDEISPDKPVFLWRACMHIGVANTKAFEICGISLSSPPKQSDGSFDVDEEGIVTGIVREEATQFITKNTEEKDPEVRKEYLRAGLRECLESGLTSVQTNDEFCFDLYKQLDQEGQLPLRVNLTSAHAELDGTRIPYTSTTGMLFQKRIKLFADGSLGAGTAALLKDNTGEYTGIMYHDLDQLHDLIAKAIKRGFQIEIHIIGDAAADTAIRALEMLELSYGERPVLTHCQVLNERLIDRIAKLGAVANIQPSFVPTDARWVEKRLPPEKLPWAYCWKTLLENGIHVSGGSDSPIESCSPLKGMYDAVFRPRSHDQTTSTFNQKEQLEFFQALHLCTLGANYASKSEHRRGDIDVGWDADFVVIDTDVAREPHRLRSAEILQVWVNGVCRYENSAKAATSKNRLEKPRFPHTSGKNGASQNYIRCTCKIPFHAN